MTLPEPHPGSPEAVAAGCTCGRQTNNDGAGLLDPRGNVYWITREDCPLHGYAANEER